MPLWQDHFLDVDPSAARRRAMVRPMPRDAPVTIAVFLMVVLLVSGFFELEVRR